MNLAKSRRSPSRMLNILRFHLVGINRSYLGNVTVGGNTFETRPKVESTKCSLIGRLTRRRFVC